ncbi:MAG: response regulator [Deltaproteobacteria bacterium]|nr:response regulator [Deltaproteobacteria bacterium]
MARILVCDDEELIRCSLSEHLKAGSYDVTQAADGVEALEKIEAAPPDALIVDLEMPRLDGLSVLRKLKADGHPFPVIVITAPGALDSAIEATRLGAAGYVSKPFDLREIALLLERVLEKDRLETEVRWLRDRVIQLEELPVAGSVAGAFELPDEGVDLAAVERGLVEQALARTHGNQTQAAKLLGISRFALRHRIDKHGVEDLVRPAASSG